MGITSTSSAPPIPPSAVVWHGRRLPVPREPSHMAPSSHHEHAPRSACCSRRARGEGRGGGGEFLVSLRRTRPFGLRRARGAQLNATNTTARRRQRDLTPPECTTDPTLQGTLINMLLEEHRDKMAFSVSHTTRKPRAGEKDGVHYHFTPKDKMEQKIKEMEQRLRDLKEWKRSKAFEPKNKGNGWSRMQICECVQKGKWPSTFRRDLAIC